MKHRISLLALLLLAPALTWSGNADTARIVTQEWRESECIGPVTIRKIDGRNRFVSPQGFDLEPGKHSLSGTVAFNSGDCPAHAGNPRGRTPAIAPLEADFEAGKTYYLGFDHSSADPDEWAYVIWKVE